VVQLPWFGGCHTGDSYHDDIQMPRIRTGAVHPKTLFWAVPLFIPTRKEIHPFHVQQFVWGWHQDLTLIISVKGWIAAFSVSPEALKSIGSKSIAT